MPHQINHDAGQGPAGPPTPPIVEPTYEESERRFLEALQGFNPDSIRQPAVSTAARPTPTGERQPSLVQRAARGVRDIVTDPHQTMQSVGRGVVNLADDLAETGISVGAWLLRKAQEDEGRGGLLAKLLLDDEWTQTVDALGPQGVAEAGTEFIDRANDWIFGKQSESGGQQFVEDVSQFLSGFLAAGQLKLLRGGPSLAALGPVVGGAARGAFVDFAAFDPYEAQLAELAASSRIAGIRELGDLLSVTEDDGPVAARLKRTVGGIIPGVAVDGLVATARFVRHLRVFRDPAATAAEKAAAQTALEEQARVLQDISDGTHTPADPVVVKPTADGRWTLEVNEAENARLLSQEELTERNRRSSLGLPRTGPVSELDVPAFQRRKAQVSFEGPDRRVASASVDDAPTFDARWQAEGQAASINEALAQRFNSSAVKISKQQMDDIFQLARRIEEAIDDPDQIVELLKEAKFNFSYMDSPEKVESLLRAVGEVLSPVFERAQAAKGVTWQESIERTMQLAGMVTREDAPDLLRNASNVLKNSDAFLGILNVRLMELGSQVSKWSEILDARPLDGVANAEAKQALRAYVELAADVAGSNSGVGRGLSFLKARAQLPTAAKFKGEAGAAAAPAAGELAPDVVAGMTAAELRNVTRLFRLSKEPRVLFNTLATEIRPQNIGKAARFGSGMLEYFYNSILSSPATHFAIFLANGTVSAIEDAVRFMAGVVRRDPEMIQEAADLVQGRLIFLKQSIKGMGSAFIAGHSIIDPRPIYKRIPGVAGEFVRTFGTRPIAAMDEFWRVNNNLAFVRMNSLKLARREAASRGLKGTALDNFLSQRVEADVKSSIDPATGASRLPDARRFASLPTFSSPLRADGFGASLEDLVQKHSWLIPIMPFVRTSINVLDYTFAKSSPLGLFSSNVRKQIASGSPEGAILATRMTLGTTMWGTAGLLAFGGDITGNGPSDARLRKMWLASHQPYSIRIGGKWVSYRRLEPFATAMSVMADLAQILRDNADDLQVQEDGSKVFYGVVAASVSGMTNKTYLSGLIEFFNAIGSRSPAKMKNFVDGMIEVAVPNVLQAVNNDPYMRETKRMFDALVNRVPGWSQSLPAKYNVFGEPVALQPGRTQRTLNPFPIRDGTPMLEDEVLQLHRAFLAPPTIVKFGNLSVNLHDRRYQNKNGGTLTPYERLMEIVQEQDLRGQLTEIVNSPAYQRSGDGTEVFAGGRRFRELQDRIERVYNRAERRMLSEYPALKQDLRGLGRARRASQRSDVQGESILDRIGN